MGDDRMRHEAEELKGQAKEKAGGMTGNEQAEGEGAAEQSEAKLKKAGDKLKDAAEDAKNAFKK